ncbi:MAG: glycosyltransferase family 87 protein [Chloroflexota bacterium]|nr:glycosyltransferase family 87 protein [Chloroflexota bacterium]
MSKVLHQLRTSWSSSKAFRVILVISVIYTVLRLAGHGAYLVTMLSPGQGTGGELPEWVGAEGPMIPADLQIYLNAAKHFQLRQDLYLKGSLARLEDHYPYAPSFALAFIPFLWLPLSAVVVVHTLLHVAAYALLYVWWGRIFRRLGLDRANEMLAWTLPVWLVFSAFWGDLGYLNIYIIITLMGTLFIDAVLDERLGWSLLWLSIILQIKPHWAFAAAVPLLLGRHRFFFRLVVLTVVAYAAIVGVTMLVAGVPYAWQQHIDYVQFLARLSRDFPWRGPNENFLGYNHSIVQIVVYLLGVTPGTMRLAMGVKVLLLLPLAVVALRHLFRPARRPGRDVPQLSLDVAFVLYLGAFIWLDMVWEVSLGIAVFTYLLATLERRNTRILVWAVFLPYALVDLWQLASFAVFGFDVIAPGPYILTDPSIYVPLVMIVILTFYALLLKRLWVAVPVRQTVEVE